MSHLSQSGHPRGFYHLQIGENRWVGYGRLPLQAPRALHDTHSGATFFVYLVIYAVYLVIYAVYLVIYGRIPGDIWSYTW